MATHKDGHLEWMEWPSRSPLRKVPLSPALRFYDAQWHPAGRLLAWSDAATVRVATRDDATIRTVYASDARQIGAFAFSHDGRRVAVADDLTVVVLDFESGRKISTYADSRTVHALAFSPDGETLAVVGADPHWVTVDPRTGAQLRTFPGHGEPLNAVAWHPTGSRVATASLDGSVRIWDPAAGMLLALEAESPVVELAWDPAGEVLAAITDRAVVHLWDARPPPPVEGQ
jgi:WD40 repeat protein